MYLRAPIYWLMLSVWLSGCVVNQPREDLPHSPNHAAIGAWVEGDLVPYLVEQLGRHPRFKGEPVLLVAMDGDNVEPSIDRLRDEIRVKLFDSLLSVAEVNVAWRPTVRPWRHHRSLAELRCGNSGDIHYYIGLDTRTGMDGNTHLSIRALDVREGQWVSGFGRQWQGGLTAGEQRALEDNQPDETLRGLRPLPFSSAQADLTAAYLARNLSCLLQQRPMDRVVVYVERTEQQDHFFQTVMNLVGNYLSQFREVHITDNRAAANVVLAGEVHAIHTDLYQVWTVARLSDGGEHLSGADTAAYVRLKTRSPLAATTPPEPPPVRLTPAPPSSVAIIHDFFSIAPLSQAFCRSRAPWAFGARQVGGNGHLATGGCLGLELELAKDAWVFLVHENRRGELTELWPGGCGDTSLRGARMEAGLGIQLPQATSGTEAVIELNDGPSEERFIALATRNRQAAAQLRVLTRGLPGICRDEPESNVATGLEQFTAVGDYFPGDLEVREIFVRHE